MRRWNRVVKDKISVRAAIEAASPRQFVRLESVSPKGALELRKSPNGSVAFYFRFYQNGESDREQIGLYDKLAPPKSVNPTEKGYSISAARAAAAALSAKHYEARNDGGLRAVLESEKAHAREMKEAAAAAAASKAHTLERLVDVYINTRRNPETGKDIRKLFNKNVKVAFPGVAATPASEVTSEQIASVLRKMLEAGHKTTARQLRAYLRSAFEHARQVENDASISKDFATFNIKHNPVADVANIANTRGVDKNPLMPEALREYWKLIDVPGKEAAFLRLHLLSGGQRLGQLIRLKRPDVKRNVLILEDTKGRSGNVRHILVPLIPATAKALKEFASDEEFVFSVSPGRHISMTTVRRWMKMVMPVVPDGFQLKRVRSGVTTLLAKLKVPKEIRDHLQSHGLSSVEDRHYNLYDYFDEKKEALTKMYSFLTSAGEKRQQNARSRNSEVKRKGIFAWKKGRRG